MCYYIFNKKNIIGFCNTSHLDSMNTYPLETTENEMNVMKHKLLVTKNTKHFPSDKYIGNFVAMDLNLIR